MNQLIRSHIENDPDLRISVKAVFLQVRNGDLCVLLGLHKEHQRFMLPGGGIEHEDWKDWSAIEAALARELLEELGLRIWDVYSRSSFLLEVNMLEPKLLRCPWESKGKPREDVCFCFYLPPDYQLPFDEENLPGDSELQSVRWVPINSTEFAVFENTRRVLKALPSYLNGTRY